MQLRHHHLILLREQVVGVGLQFVVVTLKVHNPDRTERHTDKYFNQKTN